jgi:phenylpropionate dioxygenase-like ring-hydroxylating dioxygenase large terminal subunit
VRGRAYKFAGLPQDIERRLKACRYLGWRINWPVFREDNVLIESVQRGLESSGYEVGVLSEKEICVRQLHDQIRRRLPVARLHRAPETGKVGAHNDAQLAAMPPSR